MERPPQFCVGLVRPHLQWWRPLGGGLNGGALRLGGVATGNVVRLLATGFSAVSAPTISNPISTLGNVGLGACGG
jgi:hypothetical protein